MVELPLEVALAAEVVSTGPDPPWESELTVDITGAPAELITMPREELERDSVAALLSSETASELLLSSGMSNVPSAFSMAALQTSSASQSLMAALLRVHMLPESPSTNGGP
jgi:hypothetical protein